MIRLGKSWTPPTNLNGALRDSHPANTTRPQMEQETQRDQTALARPAAGDGCHRVTVEDRIEARMLGRCDKHAHVRPPRVSWPCRVAPVSTVPCSTSNLVAFEDDAFESSPKGIDGRDCRHTLFSGPSSKSLLWRSRDSCPCECSRFSAGLSAIELLLTHCVPSSRSTRRAACEHKDEVTMVVLRRGDARHPQDGDWGK